MYPATSIIFSLPGSSFNTKYLKYNAIAIEIIPAIKATSIVNGTSMFLSRSDILMIFI